MRITAEKGGIVEQTIETEDKERYCGRMWLASAGQELNKEGGREGRQTGKVVGLTDNRRRNTKNADI